MSEQTTSVTGQGGSRPIDPKARIGHVHLKVADLDRALAFYCGVLGFGLMQRYGEQALPSGVALADWHHSSTIQPVTRAGLASLPAACSASS